MRPRNPTIITDHDYLLNQTPNDHHAQGSSYTVIVNSLSIAPGTYEHRVFVGPDFRTVEVCLRGNELTNMIGNTGFWGFGTNVQQESCGESIRPYGGSYYTSYMGAYSRLHGDSYLTHPGVFGDSIRLVDVWYDSTNEEVVHVFENIAGVNKNLTVYGAGTLK